MPGECMNASVSSGRTAAIVNNTTVEASEADVPLVCFFVIFATFCFIIIVEMQHLHHGVLGFWGFGVL